MSCHAVSGVLLSCDVWCHVVFYHVVSFVMVYVEFVLYMICVGCCLLTCMFLVLHYALSRMLSSLVKAETPAGQSFTLSSYSPVLLEFHPTTNIVLPVSLVVLLCLIV